MSSAPARYDFDVIVSKMEGIITDEMANLKLPEFAPSIQRIERWVKEEIDEELARTGATEDDMVEILECLREQMEEDLDFQGSCFSATNEYEPDLRRFLQFNENKASSIEQFVFGELLFNVNCNIRDRMVGVVNEKIKEWKDIKMLRGMTRSGINI